MTISVCGRAQGCKTATGWAAGAKVAGALAMGAGCVCADSFQEYPWGQAAGGVPPNLVPPHCLTLCWVLVPALPLGDASGGRGLLLCWGGALLHSLLAPLRPCSLLVRVGGQRCRRTPSLHPLSQPRGGAVTCPAAFSF